MARSSLGMLSLARRRLAEAGCVAPEQEAAELLVAADGDEELLCVFLDRRTRGEPLAWITGAVVFCGCTVTVAPGVYVPRWQSEPLAERAAALLPLQGRAIDLGTGSGAIARVLLDRRPDASVLGTEIDPIAAECARRNGVDVVEGDLFDGIDESWRGSVDLIVAVLPYVPAGGLSLLPRDVLGFEPETALDGGEDGLDVVRRAIAESHRWLRGGGHVLLEVGGDQPDLVTPALRGARFGEIQVFTDAEGDPRGVEAVALEGSSRDPSTISAPAEQEA